MTTTETTTTPTTPAEQVTPAEIVDPEQKPAETTPGGSEGDADAPDDNGKPKGVRARLDATEAERDVLRAQLDAAHAQAFDRTVEAMGLQPALMRAAGLEVAEFVVEDGSLDTVALTTAIDTKRSELGLSRRPAPNPVAGLGSGDAPDMKPSSWAGAFAEHTGRAKPQ